MLGRLSREREVGGPDGELGDRGRGEPDGDLECCTRREPGTDRHARRDLGVEPDRTATEPGENREHRGDGSTPFRFYAGSPYRAVGRDVDRVRERGRAHEHPAVGARIERDPHVLVDRDREAESGLVVGVIADQIDPARSPNNPARAAAVGTA